MPAGRPPKPTALRRVQGNPGKRPLNEREPVPAEGAPKPPRWLGTKARQHWRDIAPILESMRVVTAADRQALALLCDVLAEYVASRKVLDAEGMTYETSRIVGETTDEDGATVPIISTMIRARPEVAMAADAWRRASAMLQQFGLTPSSRSKIQSAPPESKDRFEELFGLAK